MNAKRPMSCGCEEVYTEANSSNINEYLLRYQHPCASARFSRRHEHKGSMDREGK